ncbi:MAG: hypothetical protein C4325_12520, partial [Blastocatellia bacterium]
TASASIRNPQTFNRYSYVLNSPYKFTDPLGLLPSKKGVADGGRAWCSTCKTTDEDPWFAEPITFTLVYSQEYTDQGIAENQGTEAGQQQQAEEPEPPPPPQDRPYFARDKSKDLQRIDQELTSIFTDTGTILGASSVMFPSGFNHHKFADGQVHTLHIYGNDAATASAGVYIPKEFSDVKITSKDTVVARNPNTKEVILIAHVRVGTSMKQLRKNMKTVRENGTMYIGQIGG